MKITKAHHSQNKNSLDKKNPYKHTFKTSISSLKPKIIPFSPRKNLPHQAAQYDQMNYTSSASKSHKL